MTTIAGTKAKLVWAALFAYLGTLLWRIATFGQTKTRAHADAAIILGAGLIDEKPSPVFLERIRHGFTLFQRGQVDFLVLTGGIGRTQRLAESMVAKELLIRWGLPAAHLLTETDSFTTIGNLLYARDVMEHHTLKNALVVSDPYHLLRATTIARDLGIDASPSATPSTRIRSWRTRSFTLAREAAYYTAYVLGRSLNRLIERIS